MIEYTKADVSRALAIAIGASGNKENPNEWQEKFISDFLKTNGEFDNLPSYLQDFVIECYPLIIR